MVLPVQVKLMALLMVVLQFSNQSISKNQSGTAKDGFYLVNDYGKLSINYKGKLYHLEDTPFCKLSNVKSSTLQLDKANAGLYELAMVMDEKGTAAFEKATDMSFNETRIIALVVNNKIVSAAHIASHIVNGKVALTNSSKRELQQIQLHFK